LRKTTISALLATFVMGTSVDLGCCQPQVLPFEYKEHANKFIHGFGGTVHTFQDAIDVLHHKMAGTIHSCHS